MDHFRAEYFEEIDSTNSEAIRRVNSGGLSMPTVFWAGTQTAGKGTRGRSWQSQSGNVHASFVFPLSIEFHKSPFIVYSIALAVADTIKFYLSSEDVKIKWPNDILVNNKKVSGSLHEVAAFRGTNYFVAGIGINNSWKPAADIIYPVSCIADFCETAPGVSEIIEFLGGRIAKRVEQFELTGFADQKKEFLANSYQFGQLLQIQLRGDRGDVHEGIYEGLDDQGALILSTKNGIQRFVAGDIFPQLKV